MSLFGRRRAVRLRARGELLPPSRGAEVAAISVDHLGRVLTTWVDRNDHERVARTIDPEDGFPLDPLPFASGRERAVPAVITVQDPGVVQTVGVQALDLDGATIQAMPGGGFLVVNARSWWRPAGPELNATLLDDEGWVVQQACLGDGITHVQTTGAGQVWVGYSDEGVYGNLGWGDPGAPPPIGSPGIRRFAPDLVPEWAFAHEGQVVDDCYSLNVVGDTAWSCYYSDFPLVRIDDGRVEVWPTRVAGADVLLVGDDEVALVGGYGEHRDRVVAGPPSTFSRRPRELRLSMPDGTPVPADAVRVGRGDRLDVFCGRDWFQIAIDDLR